MPYVARRRYKDRWPTERDRHRWREEEPLAPGGPRMLALAVIYQAIRHDMPDPRRTLPVLRWLVGSGVMPEAGPVARRKLLPEAIATAERVLRGDVTGQPRRYKHRLALHHRAALAGLIREHRERATV